MTRHVFRLAAVALLLTATGRATEPPNLDPHKDQIRAYVKSGAYEQDLAAVARRARTWIAERAKRGGGRLAVVFDLDETLLSNWPEMDREDLGFEPAAFDRWTESAGCPVIEPVQKVYELARRLGLGVMFISSRRERFRAATERNLRSAGCGDCTAVFFLPDAARETAADFKTAVRAKLEAAGWTIIANIGDQESDLAGGHAERTFKLPDPFYLTP